jgi:hypothetical protein
VLGKIDFISRQISLSLFLACKIINLTRRSSSVCTYVCVSLSHTHTHFSFVHLSIFHLIIHQQRINKFTNGINLSNDWHNGAEARWKLHNKGMANNLRNYQLLSKKFSWFFFKIKILFQVPNPLPNHITQSRTNREVKLMFLMFKLM